MGAAAMEEAAAAVERRGGEGGGGERGNGRGAAALSADGGEDAAATAAGRAGHGAAAAVDSSSKTAAAGVALFIDAEPLDDEGVLTLIELSSTHPVILTANTRLQKDLLEAANKACADAAELERLSRQQLLRMQEACAEKAEKDEQRQQQQWQEYEESGQGTAAAAAGLKNQGRDDAVDSSDAAGAPGIAGGERGAAAAPAKQQEKPEEGDLLLLQRCPVLLTPEKVAEAGAVALKEKRQLLEGQMKRCRMLLDACNGLIVDLDSLDFSTLKPLWGDERSVRQSRKCLTQLIEKMTDRLETANNFLKKIFVRLPPPPSSPSLPPTPLITASSSSSSAVSTEQARAAAESDAGAAAAALTRSTAGWSEDGSPSIVPSEYSSPPRGASQVVSSAAAFSSSSSSSLEAGPAPLSPAASPLSPPLAGAAGAAAAAAAPSRPSSAEAHIGLIPGDFKGTAAAVGRGRGVLPGGTGRGRGVLLAAGRGRGVGMGRGASSSSPSESDSDREESARRRGGSGGVATVGSEGGCGGAQEADSGRRGTTADSGKGGGAAPAAAGEGQSFETKLQQQKKRGLPTEEAQQQEGVGNSEGGTGRTAAADVTRRGGRGREEGASPPRWRRKTAADVDWLLKCRKKLCELKERTVRKAVSDVFIKERTVQETIEFMNHNAEKLKTVAEKPKAAITSDDRRVFMRSIESYIAGLDKACSLVAKQAMNKRQLMSLFESACKIEKFQTPHELLMEMKNTVSLLQTFVYMPPSRDDDSSS